MDIVGTAKRLERRLARSVDAALGELVGSAVTEPLEIIYLVLDRIEQEVQHAGRGRRTFPFTRIRILVPIPPRERHARARFDAALAGPPSVEQRVRERLESAGVKDPQVVVESTYATRPAPGWENPAFHVEFVRDIAAQTAPAAQLTAAVLRLAIIKGKAAHRSYTFSGGRVDIGRRSEVLDSRHRLVRTNQVAFLEDGADVNASVSRRHAHIVYDGAARAYRLIDDRSAHGTGIVRGGRTISVHPGARGVRLEDGDEVLLGQARIRIAIAPGTE